MKYRNITIGEVIPKNAEISVFANEPWEPFWDADYKEGVPNVCFPDGWLRAPIEKDN